ncbi:MAG: hypothetical protein JNK71_01975 [Methyloversatilis sp.]|nr:hypothetical protein [Methyloversatilis sp.]
MADLSGIMPHDATSASGTSGRARSYRQAWLDALEDASMSRSDRWKMPAHDPAGDERERGRPASPVVPIGVSTSQGATSPTATARVRRATPDPAHGEGTAMRAPHDAMRSSPGAAVSGIERAPRVRSTAPVVESLPASPVSSRPEALLWQRQRLTVLPSAEGGVEVWVRDAALSGASRVAGLLQDLRRTFGETAASLVKVAVNGKVIYRQDAATRAGRPHSEVTRDGS